MKIQFKKLANLYFLGHKKMVKTQEQLEYEETDERFSMLPTK